MADKMVDMELDDEQIGDMQAQVKLPETPRYPYGLRISLTKAELGKLQLDAGDAFVGGYVHGHFLACITSVSMNENQESDDCRVELQIERLAVESEDEENEEMEAMNGKGRRRSPLYTRMARKEAIDATESK